MSGGTEASVGQAWTGFDESFSLPRNNTHFAMFLLMPKARTHLIVRQCGCQLCSRL